jgi:hypothetical protein
MVTYLLPNGCAIDYELLRTAISETNKKNCFYLDTQTGKIILAKEKAPLQETHLQKMTKDRYILIEPISEKIRYSWIPDLIEWIEEDGNRLLATQLSQAYASKQSLANCLKIIKNAGRDGEMYWQCWEQECISEFCSAWIDSLPIPIKEKTEWFDDCPVCQLMKQAEEAGRQVDAEELEKVMKKTEMDRIMKDWPDE